MAVRQPAHTAGAAYNERVRARGSFAVARREKQGGFAVAVAALAPAYHAGQWATIAIGLTVESLSTVANLGRAILDGDTSNDSNDQRGHRD